jgi:heat shock protein HslJ/membrane-bound inhibitor of C-type lysozyme
MHSAPFVRLVAAAVLAGLLGCNAVPTAAPGVAATRSLLSCGDQAASVVFDADGAWLVAAGSGVALKPVVSGSGARYEAPGDSGTWLWNKGASTMVSLRGEPWPECRTAAEPPFRAVGQEPGWRLDIDGAAARLTLGMGADVIGATLPEARITRSTRSYKAESSAGPMTVVITEQRCADSMSGMPHPAVVQVGVRGQVFKGCGGEPSSLLTGPEWRVQSIAGAPPAEGSRVSLRFGADGSLSGTAGCNRFTSRWQLSGEGLTVSPPAATRMACPALLMAQEGRVVSLLGGVQGFDIAADGSLLLRTASGQNIVARRP